MKIPIRYIPELIGSEEPPIEPTGSEEPPIEPTGSEEPPIEPTGSEEIYDATKLGIVEGIVSDEIAQQNTDTLNYHLTAAKESGVYRFVIDSLDAYFNANSLTEQTNNSVKMSNEGIKIPSDMTLEMSNNTYLRVQPNNMVSYWLLNFYDADNITVKGGNLIGDKYEHDYSYNNNQGTHEYGFLTALVGCHNITIDGVTMTDATGDAVFTSNKWIRTINGELINGNRTAEDIIIKNCIINGSRRNNISPVDGNRITIDNNIIKNAGEGDYVLDSSGNKIMGWWGTLPKTGIDLESYRERGADGSLHEYQRIENVIISNNTFIGSANPIADLVLYTTNNVEVFGNTFTKGIGNTAAFNISIHDNTFKASQILGTAISMGQRFNSITNEPMCYNYKIYNNIIEGYQYGISIGVKDAELYGNILNECLYVSYNISNNAENIYIHDETINSTQERAYGLKNWITASTSTNVLVERVKSNATKAGLSLLSFTGLGDGLTIRDCDFKGGISDVIITNSSNILLENSRYTTIEESGNTNVTIN